MRYQLTKAHGVAEVASVGDFNERRSLTELNGEGEVVSGIAMARYGENALNVISHIKAKIREISAGLSAGVSIHAVYDRSELIYKAISTLQRTLLEESLIVAAVCGVFLLHVRLAMVAILMLLVGVLMAFIAMHALGINANLMRLGGIAIAIGAMVDAAIVMIDAPTSTRSACRKAIRCSSAPTRCWPPARRLARRCFSRRWPAPRQHRARPRAARPPGVSVGELQDVIATALGAELVTTMVAGRERVGVSVRYPRELRSNPLGSYLADARRAVNAQVTRPPGTQDDDGGGHHGRPAADPVGHRHRLGGDEPHRRADGRRHGLVHRVDAGGEPSAVCAGQATGMAAGAGAAGLTARRRV